MSGDMPNLFHLAVESVTGMPIADGSPVRTWTFKPSGIIHVPHPTAMHIEMKSDGVHVTAKYETNEALFLAFKSFLEQNGYIVTEIE